MTLDAPRETASPETALPDEICVTIRSAAQPVAEIEVETRLWRIPKVLAAGFADTRRHIEASGASVADMPYARFLDIDWHDLTGKSGLAQFWDFLTSTQTMRVGMMASQAVEGSSDVMTGEFAAGKYVTAVHRGPYHKVGDAYREIVQWAAAENIALADNSLEHYIEDPGEVGMQNVRTRIWIAVR